MKTEMKLLFALIFLIISAKSNAQEKKNSDQKKFKVIVEKTSEGITMKCIEGSAWTDLSFSLNNGRPQAIDEYGMADLNNSNTTKDANLADFLFTVVKTRKGIELRGINGTSWKTLSFSLAKNVPQAIDQDGMTSLN